MTRLCHLAAAACLLLLPIATATPAWSHPARAAGAARSGPEPATARRSPAGLASGLAAAGGTPGEAPPAGTAGAAGAAGPPGEARPAGTAGAAGAAGMPGEARPAGTSGAAGAAGMPGEARPAGTSGAAGAAGAAVGRSGAPPLTVPAARPAGVLGVAAEPADGWRWPVPGRPRVVRPFAPPLVKYGPGHRGVDLAAPAGSPVLAAGSGVVAYAGILAGRGVVSIQHANGLRTTYEPVQPVVPAGARVAAGTVIGRLVAGHPGCPEVSCLHWGLRRGDTYLDPLDLLRRGPVRLLPLGEPLPPGGPPPGGPPPGGPPLGGAPLGGLAAVTGAGSGLPTAAAAPSAGSGPAGPSAVTAIGATGFVVGTLLLVRRRAP